MRLNVFRSVAVLLMLLGFSGCRSGGIGIPEGEKTGQWWDLEKAETLVWRADHPGYEQHMALEGSGLVAHDGRLLAASEKYAQLLRIDPVTLMVEAISMDLPPLSEIEGVAVDGGELLLCDEANAAVWATAIPGEKSGISLEMRQIELIGLELKGGKLGVEGITVDSGPAGDVYLMLERSGSAEVGCKSTIFRLSRQGDQLVANHHPLVISLEDCNWRLTGLQFWNGRLLALKTRYPGERYEVVVVDKESGELTTVLEMTELLRGIREQGWGNNIEGLTVTSDGALWLISDNAMTDQAWTDDPPPCDDKTLLMRIPGLNLPSLELEPN